VAARGARQESTAAALFEAALAGGSGAAGLRLGGLVVGERADFCMTDAHAPALAGIPAPHVLDALVFSAPTARMARVCVGGRDVSLEPLRAEFVAAMQSLG